MLVLFNSQKNMEHGSTRCVHRGFRSTELRGNVFYYLLYSEINKQIEEILCIPLPQYLASSNEPAIITAIKCTFS